MAYIKITYPKFAAETDTGTPAVGWLLYTYVAGTSTEATTYSDRNLSTANTNPIVLDSRGEADVYVNQTIKLVLKTDTGAAVFTQDYAGEMLSTFYTGSSSGTTDNVYDVTVSPIPSAYTDCMTVIFTPDVNNTETIGTLTFTGTGPNDAKVQGPYAGTTSSTFRIEIDGTGSPNTFKWRKDAEAYTTTVAITGAWQTLKEGIQVKFSVLTGHVLGAYWTQAVDPPAEIDVNDIGAKVVYKNVGGDMVALDGSDIVADYPATVVYSDAQDCWILNNPASLIPGNDSSYGIRDRFEKTDNYTLSVNDAGNLVEFTAATAKTLILDAVATYNGMFFYIRAGAAGYVTIDADGTELIYGPQSPAGAGTYVLRGGRGKTVQLQCNGVSWEILTETPVQDAVTVYSYTGSAQTWTKYAGLQYVEVEVYGGGGNGVSPGGPGGCGGGYSYKKITATSLGATETVTVGTAEGTSSFGSHCSATGGTDTTPGAGSDGDINSSGEFSTDAAASLPNRGGAGAGPLGGCGVPEDTAANDVGGGGGGGGAATNNGAAGKVIVREYY